MNTYTLLRKGRGRPSPGRGPSQLQKAAQRITLWAKKIGISVHKQKIPAGRKRQECFK
jgi:hypothetical protein